MTIIGLIYNALKAFGLIEGLIKEHEARQKAQEIANAPLDNAEEAADLLK